jgi:hypothetical protein
MTPGEVPVILAAEERSANVRAMHSGHIGGLRLPRCPKLERGAATKRCHFGFDLRDAARYGFEQRSAYALGKEPVAKSFK